MEVFSICSLSVRSIKDLDRARQVWIYCVVRVGELIFCSKTSQMNCKDWVELIGKKDFYEIELQNGQNTVQLEIWNYDTQSKIADFNLSSSDFSIQRKQKQFTINNREINIKLASEHKQHVDDSKENQKNIQRLNYNKSDTNLKFPIKSGSTANLKKYTNPIEQIQICNKYEPNALGRWRFIPIRNQINPHKLKL